MFWFQKKAHQNRKFLGTNKAIQALGEFYPTTNILLSMSRKGSAIMYHAQGCCKATCKAPSCVPGELPAATASEHFKASDRQASESTSPTTNTLPLHHYTRQHNRAKHPWHECMSGCHFCLTLAFPAAYTVPQLTLRPTRCCCQHSVRKICSLKRKHRCSVSPFAAWPTTLHSKALCHLNIIPCLEPNSSTNKTEADYSKAVFPYVRYRKELAM